MNEIEEKIFATMAVILGVDRATLTESSSVDTVEAWDSLKHMNLVIALEEAFRVEFTDDEVGEIVSFKLIRSILKEKISK